MGFWNNKQPDSALNYAQAQQERLPELVNNDVLLKQVNILVEQQNLIAQNQVLLGQRFDELMSFVKEHSGVVDESPSQEDINEALELIKKQRLKGKR